MGIQNLLLLDTRNDKHHLGIGSIDLAVSSGIVELNYSDRTAMVKGHHKLSYNKDDYRDDHDFTLEACKDAISYVVRNHDYVLFKSA